MLRKGLSSQFQDGMPKAKAVEAYEEISTLCAPLLANSRTALYYDCVPMQFPILRLIDSHMQSSIKWNYQQDVAETM
jgi:hypothetical protein